MGLRSRRVRRVWLWRWRRNPLKRRSDTLEAWVLLGAWTLTVLCGVLAGTAVAGAVERSMARERAEFRPVAARLTEPAPGAATVPAAAHGAHVWAEVAWTAPDGIARTGQARVRPGTGTGAEVTVWTDDRGRLVTRPASPAQARVRSSLVGVLAGLGAAAVPLAAGRAVRSGLEGRRLQRWEADWARFDPLWGHRTS
ncbi:Rv1733c family protein [Streptomyces sp. enrichment culture]|uniref:Rv1733c family protein n=1 Tax=Streptomyces sp. enrichment culture TaxID=1795815 RepID=UPI003F563DB2